MNLLDQISTLVAEDRLAHGYVVRGDPMGEGKAFAVEVMVRLFEGTAKGDPAKLRHRIETRVHPDVLWVEPASKLRQIVVKDVEGALKRVHEKSFEGGWKAVVFLGAERMNASVGNKLLKSLEEPPPKTLILLVSGVPEQLLTTLRSRCQLLIAPSESGPPPEWEADLLDLLRMGPPRNLLERLQRAARFRDFLQFATANLEEETEDEEGEGESEEVDEAVANAREAAAKKVLYRKVMEAVEAWYRDVLVLKTAGEQAPLRYPSARDDLRQQSENLQIPHLLKLLDNCRDIAARFDTNVPVHVVLDSAVI
ncbi:MAG: hypothetical protein JJU29_08215 [Verrucomicrobia bacterium]|nr:hypothetical protein [Verrucomicrobiota bacterium]MCH8512095.1 hypothetical protein [Kiritimatiellia bacterium]